MNLSLFALAWLWEPLCRWSIVAIVIVAFTQMMMLAMRKASASLKHTVWLAASICILITPLGARIVPGLLPPTRLQSQDNLPLQAEEQSGSISQNRLRALGGLKEAERIVLSKSEGESIESQSNVKQGEVEISSRPSPIEISTFWARMSNVRIWKSIACWVWIAGMVVYLGRATLARKKLTSYFDAKYFALSSELHSQALQLAKRSGLTVVAGNCKWYQSWKTLQVFVSTDETGPLVWGAMPAKLMLPASLSEMNHEDREAVISHELAHILRGDEWTRRFLLILRAIFWFHPMVNYACGRVQLSAEQACDDHVLRSGYRPSHYSRLLLQLWQGGVEVGDKFIVSGMAQTEVSVRIRSILEMNHSRRSISWFGTTTAILLMLVTTNAVWGLRPSEFGNYVTESSKSSLDEQDQGNDNKEDWAQFGGSPNRNGVAEGSNIPVQFDVESNHNVHWTAELGYNTHGSVVVANGLVFVGTGNGAAYLDRFPATVDLGVLLCFSEEDGAFLWQHSNEKLPQGRINDWPSAGVCSTPLVDGDRLWYVNNRGEVVCLDTDGFRDGTNDGPVTNEDVVDEEEADVVWVFDMMKQLGVSQHNMANCSVTSAGELLFVCTSQGIDEGHMLIATPQAPSFLCMNKMTGEVLWTDNSPGENILHGQWSSPAYGVIAGVPQVIFGGGDGYVYGFAAEGENGKSKLLWKFDCNPKDSVYMLNKATRISIIASPVIYQERIYIAVGEDPEHGEGPGRLWCIDPTKRGDISPTLVFNDQVSKDPLPHRRLKALDRSKGDYEKPNPNSGEIWQYVGEGSKFEQLMHRSLSNVAIKDDLLFIPDFSGVLHCLDAKTGKPHWTRDHHEPCWSSPLIVDGKVYIGTEEKLYAYELSKECRLLGSSELGDAMFGSPIVANDTLFVATRFKLHAIKSKKK